MALVGGKIQIRTIYHLQFDNESRVAGYDLLSNPATFFWGQS